MSPQSSYSKLSGFNVPSSSAPFIDKEANSSETDSQSQDGYSYDPFGRNIYRRRLHWIAHAASAVAIVALLVLNHRNSNMSQKKCWDTYNYYSPVNDAVVPHEYIHTRFNGSLWYDSPFKGPPTPEVEEAWHQAMKYGMIRVSKEDILKVKHSDIAAQFPPEAGGGYIAATMGTHQIHCLHYLWKDHHMSYFPETKKKAEDVPEMYERHYEHCTDYIRQSLMCQYDTGIIPYNWVLDHDNPTPNSNTYHKCVNWDRLQDWLQDHSVDIPDDFEWKQPADAVSLDWNP